MPDTPRGREWVARTLRELRENTGLSGNKAAQATRIQQSKISRIESAQFLPGRDEIRALCALYDAPDDVRQELLAAARDLRAGTTRARTVISRGSWQMQRNVARIEDRSSQVWVYQPTIIPGLLQTEEYMRQVFAARLPPADVERSVRERLGRAEVLESDRQFTFIIPQGALTWQAGPPHVMVEQLTHIRDVMQGRPNVRAGVIGQEQAVKVFPTHGFSVYDQRAVILGIWTGTSFITKPDEVADFCQLAQVLESTAVFGAGAQQLIGMIADGYRALA